MPITLTAEQTRAYERDGYLALHEPVFPEPVFRRLLELSERKFAEEAARAGGVAPSLIDCPHWSDPALFEWLLAPEMIDIVEPLIGPDVAIFACHLLRKPASVGKRVAWHEDSAYWKGVLEPMQVASISVSLEPSTVDNGCLSVIPGSHRHGYSEYVPVDRPDQAVFGSEIRPDQFDASRSVDVELQPNEASIHDGRLIHGSAPNTGKLARSAFTVRYFPAHVKFVPEAQPYFGDGFTIYLARGKDRAGNTYGDPTKSYRKAGTIA